MADDVKDVGTAVAAATAVAEPTTTEAKPGATVADAKQDTTPAATETLPGGKSKNFWDQKIADANEKRAKAERETATLASEIGEIRQNISLLTQIVAKQQVQAPPDADDDPDLAALDDDTDPDLSQVPAALKQVTKKNAQTLKVTQKQVSDLQKALAEREQRESAREAAETRRRNGEALNEIVDAACAGDDYRKTWEVIRNPLYDGLVPELDARGYSRDNPPDPQTAALIVETLAGRLKLGHMTGKMALSVTPSGQAAPETPAASAAPKKGVVVPPEEPEKPRRGMSIDSITEELKRTKDKWFKRA